MSKQTEHQNHTQAHHTQAHTLKAHTLKAHPMDDPAYNIISEDNIYEFISWCIVLEKQTDISNFNIILQMNIKDWIYQNNITWQYAYGNIVDTLASQKDIENVRKEQEEKEERKEQEERELKQKPVDKMKRRELFAKMAEQRSIKATPQVPPPFMKI